MDLTIDFGPDYGTRPLLPAPRALGAAFAAIVAEVTGWDEATFQRTKAAHEAAESGAMDDASERLADALSEDGSQIGTWSCQDRPVDSNGDPIPEPGDDGDPIPVHAGPWLDALPWATSDVAGAVLARDFGLITRADFEALTGWWAAVGLPLPEPRPGATFAADADEIEQQAKRLNVAEFETPGWPLAVVDAAAR